MPYTINIPVDWLRTHATVFIIEGTSRTGNPPAVYPNIVDSFVPGGFFYHYAGGGTPQYHDTFDAIGKTVFQTKEQAETALQKNEKGGSDMSLQRMFRRRKARTQCGRTTCPKCHGKLIVKPGYGKICDACGWWPGRAAAKRLEDDKAQKDYDSMRGGNGAWIIGKRPM